MSDKKTKIKELNLGLSEILTKARSSDAPFTDEHQRTLGAETGIFTVEEDLSLLNSEFVRLAEAKQWGILVSRAEGSLSSREDLEARLWWIRGQLGALSLPVSLLAAPFESVCRELSGDPRLNVVSPLLTTIGEIVLKRLKDVGDIRQERILKSVLEELGLLEVSSPVADSIADNGSSALVKTPPRMARAFELGEGAPLALEATVASAPKEKSPLKHTAVIISAALFLTVMLLAALMHLRYFSTPHLLTAQEGLIAEEFLIQLRPPLVAARAVSSNLGAIYYSIDRSDSLNMVNQHATRESGEHMPQKVKAVDKPAPATGALAGANSNISNKPQLPERPLEPQVGLGVKEGERKLDVVRTDGPIEGRDFKEGVERSSAPRPRLPDELLAPEERRAPSASSYPDGSLNIGGDIKSALVRADVFDRPSYHARVIARLMPGDKVSVEGRVGEWLRIRSKRGRAGFVYSQDIGENEDFNVDVQETDTRR
jgi:hypothetical protein